MDAPPTQYKVIERGRKLIVLDTATNLPPKQACDMNPSADIATRDAVREVEQRMAEPDTDITQADPGENEGSSGIATPDNFETRMDDLLRSASGKEGLNPASIGLGAFGFAMILAVMIGGVTGFLMAAAAIIIAGNIALKRYGKSR
ncbi:hypothetical protein [Parasphingopyxis sp.]|uniref:hypothetical protein n=1 Tax=Parasphingopyxis sp. TaxID=1920299 RepID=UPI002620D73E|nr:hypothetical protein [Parasphingopyxis sp.]